jgi:hypothetical protein
MVLGQLDPDDFVSRGRALDAVRRDPSIGTYRPHPGYVVAVAEATVIP